MELMLRTERLCCHGQICWSAGGCMHSHVWGGSHKIHIWCTHRMHSQAHSSEHRKKKFVSTQTPKRAIFKKKRIINSADFPVSLCIRKHRNFSRLWPFSCHDLNSRSEASSSHPSSILLPPLPLISSRIKVTFLSPHPSTHTPPRSGLTAAHSRRCQAEIILPVKLGNEARSRLALENEHSEEL